MNPNELHPMKVVSKRTGLSPHVLRAWEKRYGVVEPVRTPTNRRLYREVDLQRLLLLAKLTVRGYNIGHICNKPENELRELLREMEAAEEPDQASAPPAPSGGSELLQQALDATLRLDAHDLEDILRGASVTLSRPHLIDQLILPLLEHIGAMWQRGDMRVAHEHLAAAVIRSFLGNLTAAHSVLPNAPRFVVTTPAGQLHELGALMVASTAAAQGYRVLYLGPNLPAEEIAAAVQQSGARALGLSLVYPGDDLRLPDELGRLRTALPQLPMIAGGRVAERYSAHLDALDIAQLADLPSLCEWLDRHR